MRTVTNRNVERERLYNIMKAILERRAQRSISLNIDKKKKKKTGVRLKLHCGKMTFEMFNDF